MTEEVQETLPVENTPPPADVVAEVPAADVQADATTETESSSERPEETKVKSKNRPDDVFISQITDLRSKNRAKDAEIEKWRREAETARELADRLGRGEQQQSNASIKPPPLDEAEIDRRVEQKYYQREAVAIDSAGAKEFGRDIFNQNVGALSAYADEAAFHQLVGQIMNVDRANAHHMIHDLALDPDRAIALYNMDPVSRIKELTLMSIARNPDGTFAPPPEDVKTPVKQVSKAPPPAPTLQPTAHKIIHFQSPESDKLSDAEFFKQMVEHEKKNPRMARR